jgi:membrane associated rhomboid family serine protease
MKDVPITNTLGILLLTIFFLFNANVLTSIPCKKTPLDVLKSAFVHVEATHVISNLYALYALSVVERRMGSKVFLSLILWLLAFSTIGEWLVKLAIPSTPCSIGFSGVIFGLMTWELINKCKKGFDGELLAAALLLVVQYTSGGKNVSFLGHTVGAIGGIIGGLLWGNIL